MKSKSMVYSWSQNTLLINAGESKEQKGNQNVIIFSTTEMTLNYE